MLRLILELRNYNTELRLQNHNTKLESRNNDIIIHYFYFSNLLINLIILIFFIKF